MTTKLAVAVCAVVLSSGCLAVVQGDGVRAEDTREVGDFTSVRVGHGFEATVELGSPTRVVVEADQNLLELIHTDVKDGHLEIEGPGETLVLPQVGVRVHVVTPTLVEARASGGSKLTAQASPVDAFTAHASGSSTLTVTGIQAERLVGESSGLSHLVLSGTTRELKLDVSGISTVMSSDLAAELVELDVSGGSSGTVRASERVAGSVSGGSHVTIVGAPRMVVLNPSGGSSFRLAE